MNPDRLRAASLAVAKVMGWNYNGPDILKSPNPRAKEIVAIARTALETPQPTRLALLRDAIIRQKQESGSWT